jgi:hypothetical protein
MSGFRVFETVARASLLLCVVALAGSARATDNDFQLWSIGRVNHGISENWSVSFTARGRFDEDVSHAKDYLLRPYTTLSLIEGVPFVESLTVLAGYDYLGSNDGRDEHRPWQAAHHAIHRGGFRFVHRLRVDERFIDGVDPVVTRLRYRISTTQQIGSSDWYGLFSEEVFVNLNDGSQGPSDGFEQNRVRLGAGHWFFDRLRTEAGYEFHYVNRRNDTDTFRHVFFVEFSLATGKRGGHTWKKREPTQQERLEQHEQQEDELSEDNE